MKVAGKRHRVHPEKTAAMVAAIAPRRDGKIDMMWAIQAWLV